MVMADFSLETLQMWNSGATCLSTKRKNNCQPRIQYPAKVSFKYKGEMNNFSVIQKLKEFITSIFTQQEMLKEEGRRRQYFSQAGEKW